MAARQHEGTGSVSRRSFVAAAGAAALAAAAASSALASEPPAGGPGGEPPAGGPGGEPPAGGMPEGGAGGNAPTGGVGANATGQRAEGQIGSFSAGGAEDYEYDAALYVTADGIDAEKSSTDRISAGTYDAAGAEGIVIDDATAGDNGVIVVGAPYAIEGATIDLLTDADGSNTSDFTGRGSAVAAFGQGAVVEMDNTTIHTSGVATMPVLIDDGATVTMRGCTLASDGGTLSADYLNSPDQASMVCPPWILGIMGTSRCTNLLGDNSTLNALDCATSAGAWAVLSVDSGSQAYLNAYNTSLTLDNADESAAAPLQAAGGQIAETLDNPYTANYGSGYATYAIGNAVETFAGCELNVGTYATIFTGGSALYTALEAGASYDLMNGLGEVTGTYEAAEDKPTVINSDTFGFMAHQGTNALTIEKGTQVNSGFATFLVKTGSSQEQLTATVDDAQISNGGVLIQVMDNDDATNGGMMSADDARNTNGGGMNFIPEHVEQAGFTLDAGQANDGTVQAFTFTNGAYTGNVYNASGSDAAIAASRLAPTTLRVNLGAGATLTGAVAPTAAIHVTYEGSVEVRDAYQGVAFDDADKAAEFAAAYQNTDFDISHYFDIGQVANLVNDNGGNAIEVALTDDAVWNVSATSSVTSLAIEGAATVVVPDGVTLTVAGTPYSGVTLAAGDIA